MTPTATDATAATVAAEIHRRHRFTVVSHARPDGDAIGSSLAMAYALRALGKQARVVSHDPAPPAFEGFPGVDEIEVVARVDDPGDAVIVMECSDLERTGVDGLESGFVINIDHHPGNRMYGAMNWFDVSAAACGEMVYELAAALGVRLTPEIATHIYIAVLTDTGSFHYANITPRTFEICRRCVEAGVDAAAVARAVYDRNRLGRVRIIGAVLNDMRLDPSGRIATLLMTRRLMSETGGTADDTEGLINMPLTVKDIVAVVSFKEQDDADWRISLRSKGDIDVNAIAKRFGGGGHKNASGCSARGRFEELQPLFVKALTEAVGKS